MAHSFEIIFDPLAEREARARLTSCVVLPKDRFTQRIVSRGVTARLPRFDMAAHRSLCGALFFEDLPEDPPYTVELDTRAAGYLPVETQTVDVVVPGKPALGDVFLDLAPEKVIDGETAVLRGQILRDGAEIAGADITGFVAQPDAGADAEFKTTSGPRGVFALRVRLGKTTAAAATIPVPLTSTATVRARFDGVETITSANNITDKQTTNVGQIVLPA